MFRTVLYVKVSDSITVFTACDVQVCFFLIKKSIESRKLHLGITVHYGSTNSSKNDNTQSIKIVLSSAAQTKLRI